MSQSSGVAKAFGEVLEDFAKKEGISLQEAFNIAMTPASASLKQKWGAMPHEYDPEKDEYHPSKGFRVGDR